MLGLVTISHSFAFEIQIQKFMKKIYFILTVSLVFMAGQAAAQTIVTNQSTPVVSKTESDKKVVSSNRSVLSVNPNQPSVIDVNKSVQANQGAIGPNETLVVTPVVKTTVTKAQLELQSERGREYILAHPELYDVEK